MASVDASNINQAAPSHANPAAPVPARDDILVVTRRRSSPATAEMIQSPPYQGSRSASAASEYRDPMGLHATLKIAALLLWFPYLFSSLYVAYCSPHLTWQHFFRAVTYASTVIGGTYWVAVHMEEGSGDLLMIISWLVGASSDFIFATKGVDSALLPASSNTFAPTLLKNATTNATGALASALESGDAAAVAGNVFPHYGWLVVAVAHGTISGLLCKVKDLEEGRFYPCHGIGERLYMVVPFCTGQWFSFLLHSGWRGVAVENLTILLSLSTVGYCVLSYKAITYYLFSSTAEVVVGGDGLGDGDEDSDGPGAWGEPEHTPTSAAVGPLDQAGSPSMVIATVQKRRRVMRTHLPRRSLRRAGGGVDIIDFVTQLFTTSFGVVFLVIVVGNVFVTTLAVPFLKALFSLNALVSSLGFIFEYVLYDLA